MKLYGYWRSSASYRVRIALALKGIEAEYIAVNLREGEHFSPSHAKRNAQPFVPVLELEDGTKLTQSTAIIEYLDAEYGQAALLPADPVLRAQVRAAASIISADIAPIQNLRVLKYIRAEYEQDDAGVKSWAAHWIRESFKALEQIASSNDKPFLLTDTPSLAECCLIPQIYNARRFGVDMDDFPVLKQIDERCLGLTAFQKALPETQPDAPEG